MKVACGGTPISFSALNPGDCCYFETSQHRVFAIAVKSGDRLAAFEFVSLQGRTPWATYGGHPSTVFRLDGAILRPDLASLSFKPPTYGDLISANGKYYMRGAVQTPNRWFINLESGEHEVFNDTGPYAVFSRWSVGWIQNSQWVSLFEFP